MSIQMDELLKIREYDIYHNPDVSDKGIEKIAEMIASDKTMDLKAYFDLKKCSSKFCWLNYLRILEKLPEEDSVRGLPILFVLLQDENWPTFSKTMELFEAMDKTVVKSYFNQYLAQAYAKDDEMWIANIQQLAKKLN